MPGIVTCRVPEVTHIGHLDRPSDRGASRDGPAISVSDRPEAWRRIHGLNGPGVVLRSTHALWMDGFGVTPTDIAEIRRWAVSQGYMREATVWRGIDMDPETGDVREPVFTGFEEGARYFGRSPDFEACEQDAGRGALQAEAAPVLSGKGATVLERWPGRAESWEQAAILIYLRKVVLAKRPFVAGIWWPEPESVSAGSASSGLLFPERLHLFEAETEDGRFGPAPEVLDGVMIPEDPLVPA